MPKTYIAFIECTFFDEPPWQNVRERDDPEGEEPFEPREQYVAMGNGAKLSLVDLSGTKRNYTFNDGGVVEIVGNVATFVEWHVKEAPADKYQ